MTQERNAPMLSITTMVRRITSNTPESTASSMTLCRTSPDEKMVRQKAMSQTTRRYLVLLMALIFLRFLHWFLFVVKPGKTLPKRVWLALFDTCGKIEERWVPGVDIDVERRIVVQDIEIMRDFGNIMTRYWASRTLAELSGFDFQVKGNKIRLRKENEPGSPKPVIDWLGSHSLPAGSDCFIAYLPTSVNATKRRRRRKERIRYFCECGSNLMYAHECQYFFAPLKDTIRRDIQDALHQYVDANYNLLGQGLDANKTEERRQLLGEFMHKDDWLIYDRCQMLDHHIHGFATISVFDVLPTTGAYTIYSLTGRAEGYTFLCKELQQIRNDYIRSRNPNVNIVKLEQMDRNVDFGRMANAPNLLLPSVGSSWALWASLANSGRVVGLKFMKHHNDPKLLPSNFEILWNATVIYNPEHSDETAQLLGFQNSSKVLTDEGKQRLFDCYLNKC